MRDLSIARGGVRAKPASAIRTSVTRRARAASIGDAQREPPCSCGGGCQRCQQRPAMRAAMSDAATEEAGAPAAQSAAAEPAPAADPLPVDGPATTTPAEGAPPEALDDPACTAGSTTITPVDKPITAHGFTVQDAVEDATSKQGGHVASVTPTFAPYVFCPIESSGKTVKSATIAVTETKVVPTWAERGQFPKQAQDLWDRYVAVVDGHENDHIAIDTRLFTDMDKKAVNKTPAKARAALDAVITAADTANTALDNREGCIKLNGGSGAVTKHPRSDC